ncbi:MAG TPA: hypothetical protein ENI64_07705 [Gammaproteobacteria bacterium]|nr:hypothetical protein [Gammaproteobacteria bacterium]
MASILSSSLTNNQADCPYLESLGLRHSPFIPNNESLAFLDERGGQHLNLAIHLLESSHMIVIVLGKTGMGKSTLARQLQFRLPDTILPCLINAKSLTPQSLLRSMAGRLDIPQDVDLPTQRLLLAEKTVSLRHQDSVPLIIVDDAHLLDDATLDALLQIHTGTDQEYNRWELALFSNPGLEQRVAAKLATGKENIYEISLKPYNENQTRDYLLNRLQTAGYTSDNLPFTNRQFKLIFEQSSGIPARLNDAAHKILCARNSTATAAPKPRQDTGNPTLENRYPALKLQRILLLLAIGLITGILVFQDEINQLFIDKRSAINDSTISPVTPTAGPSAISDINPVVSGSEPPESTPRKIMIPPTPADITAVEPSQNNTVKTGEPDPFVTVKKTDIPKLTLPKTDNQGSASTQPQSQLLFTTKSGQAVSPAKQVAQNTTAIKTSINHQYSATAMAGQAWVMSRDLSHYTVQLLATAEEAQVQKYIDKFQIQGHSYYYPIHFRGRLLYVLLTGDFANRAIGQAAMKQLPAAILKDKPWLRALSLIQAEIKRGHK